MKTSLRRKASTSIFLMTFSLYFSCHFVNYDWFDDICFFSGNPKGAKLTHGNVVADFSGFLKVTEVNIETKISFAGGKITVWSLSLRKHYLRSSLPLCN